MTDGHGNVNLVAGGAATVVGASIDVSGSDGGGAGGVGQGAEEGDGSEEAEPSSSISELMSFRKQWEDELKEQGRVRGGGVEQEKVASCGAEASAAPQCPKEMSGERAKVLFMEGIKCEQENRLAEAIHYYRQAIQLDPQVESKVGDEIAKWEQAMMLKHRCEEEDVDDGWCEVPRELCEEFEKSCKLPRTHDDNGNPCDEAVRLCEAEVKQVGFHISDLPVEMIQLIFKWVVSDELDLRALENLSMVCRGFYVCARDEELWRLACVRVWGVRCGVPPSYRRMYLERAHVWFHGCYISRTCYLRHGEQGLDSYYRPWFSVEYYRFLRFHSDGTVCMLMSAEEPAISVGKLRSKVMSSKGHASSVAVGSYKVSGSSVMIVIKKTTNRKLYAAASRRYNNHHHHGTEPVTQTFNMELEIRSVGKRRHILLVWKSYVITMKYRNGSEVRTEFDLKPSTFPNLHFSRVKSYTQTSSTLLC